MQINKVAKTQDPGRPKQRRSDTIYISHAGALSRRGLSRNISTFSDRREQFFFLFENTAAAQFFDSALQHRALAFAATLSVQIAILCQFGTEEIDRDLLSIKYNARLDGAAIIIDSNVKADLHDRLSQGWSIDNENKRGGRKRVSATKMSSSLVPRLGSSGGAARFSVKGKKLCTRE